MAVEDAYELAYREAVRALEHQLAAVTELRGRASMLLAAASITVSLPGSHAFAGSRTLAWLAILSFVLLTACVLAIIWPRSDWRFDTDPHDLLERHLAAEPPDIARLRLNLITSLAQDRGANGRRLMRIAQAFRAGACLLAIQILSTVAAASGVV